MRRDVIFNRKRRLARDVARSSSLTLVLMDSSPTAATEPLPRDGSVVWPMCRCCCTSLTGPWPLAPEGVVKVVG
eukprot:scaffold116774_cov31-Tisochrysis_lutea.AAC.4